VTGPYFLVKSSATNCLESDREVAIEVIQVIRHHTCVTCKSMLTRIGFRAAVTQTKDFRGLTSRILVRGYHNNSGLCNPKRPSSPKVD
jgi:hypothetical protein